MASSHSSRSLESSSRGLTIGAVVLVSLLYRWIVSLFPHSGQAKPPLFGDYEAQRHWMEITYNLNVRDWYVNSSRNDLNYWGLDYPPLTAYHSYAMGYVANMINPKFVSLFESRGIETLEHKLFMRTTVFVADLLVFYPSVFLVLGRLLPAKSSASASDYLVALLLVLVNPTLLLIDHGHFQYNSLSLGLALLAVGLCISRGRQWSPLLAASVLFSMALNYKQMELYHALPFFFYLLGLCLKQDSYFQSALKLAGIGAAVLVTFGLIWAPFLDRKLELALQVLHRIFPFARGLFEDKVANVWCSVSVVVKLREMFSIEALSRLSLATTALLNLPAGLDLLLRPSRAKFLLALVNSALVFFLFSFQVHEKSILLATVPACLLIDAFPFLTVWFLSIANLSMLPLLNKDGLAIAYACTSLSFLAVGLYYYSSRSGRRGSFWPTVPLPFLAPESSRTLSKFAFAASMTGAVALSLLLLFVPAPGRLPDLWVVAICVYSCAHFVLFALVYHGIQLSLNGEPASPGDAAIVFEPAAPRRKEKRQ